jgi:hypothetical protein
MVFELVAVKKDAAEFIFVRRDVSRDSASVSKKAQWEHA